MEDARSLVEALGDWAERLLPESERAHGCMMTCGDWLDRAASMGGPGGRPVGR